MSGPLAGTRVIELAGIGISLSQTATDAHLGSRDVLLRTTDGFQPAPAPRFSRTSAARPGGPTLPGERGREALVEWGIEEARLEHLRESGVIVTGTP